MERAGNIEGRMGHGKFVCLIKTSSIDKAANLTLLGIPTSDANPISRPLPMLQIIGACT